MCLAVFKVLYMYRLIKSPSRPFGDEESEIKRLKQLAQIMIMSTPFTLRSGLIWSMNSVVILPSHAAGQRRSLDDKQPLTGGCGHHQAPSSHFSALPSSVVVPSPGVSAENLPLTRPIKIVVGHHSYQRTHLHRVVVFFFFFCQKSQNFISLA